MPGSPPPGSPSYAALVYRIHQDYDHVPAEHTALPDLRDGAWKFLRPDHADYVSGQWQQSLLPGFTDALALKGLVPPDCLELPALVASGVGVRLSVLESHVLAPAESMARPELAVRPCSASVLPAVASPFGCQWCSGNMKPFQGLAEGSIPSWRTTDHPPVPPDPPDCSALSGGWLLWSAPCFPVRMRWVVVAFAVARAPLALSFVLLSCSSVFSSAPRLLLGLRWLVLAFAVAGAPFDPSFAPTNHERDGHEGNDKSAKEGRQGNG